MKVTRHEGDRHWAEYGDGDRVTLTLPPCISIEPANTMPEERWLPVQGHEGTYEVSDRGRVRSLDRVQEYERVDAYSGDIIRVRRRLKGCVLQPAPSSSGHLTVVIHPDGTKQVHALVLEAFIGPCPDGHEGCHADDVPWNNRLENLRWGTRSDNLNDAVRNGGKAVGEEHQNAKLRESDIPTIRAEASSGPRGTIARLAREHGVAESTIRQVRDGRSWNGRGNVISIRVIDVEHTGEEEASQQALLEIGWVTLRKTDLVGGACGWEVFHEGQDGGAQLINPGRPIPVESMGIHHITDEDVADAPKTVPAEAFAGPVDYFAAFAGDEAETFKDLTGGKPWLDVRKAALRVWQDAPKHNLQTLRYWRNPVGMVRGRAGRGHRAMPDAYVAAFLLRDLLEDACTIEDILAWSAEPALEVTCWVGSGRGMKWKDVDSGLMQWVLARDFRDDIKFTCRYWLEKREAEWQRQRQDQAAEAPQRHTNYDDPPPYDDEQGAPF